MSMPIPVWNFSLKLACRFSFLTSSILNHTKIRENIKGVKVMTNMFGQVRVDRFFRECKVRLELENQNWS
jgi:hypothetical protein